MSRLILRNQTSDRVPLEAIFQTEKGLCLSSFRKGGKQVLDEGRACRIIGPHMENAPDAYWDDDPWSIQAEEFHLSGMLSKEGAEGFKIRFKATLSSSALCLEASIVSQTDSFIGISCAFALKEKKGTVFTAVEDKSITKIGVEKIPNWPKNRQNMYAIDLKDPLDFIFHPFPDPLEGKIQLSTESFDVAASYSSPCQENAWRLFSPEGSSFVSISPMSAKDPYHPNLTVSSVALTLEIL